MPRFGLCVVLGVSVHAYEVTRHVFQSRPIMVRGTGCPYPRRGISMACSEVLWATVVTILHALFEGWVPCTSPTPLLALLSPRAWCLVSATCMHPAPSSPPAPPAS